MSALTRFFFRNEVTCRTPTEVIGWWEARRGGFNLAVGGTGLFTLTAVHLISRIPPSIAIPWEPTVFIPIVYGVLANIAYTGGWAAEIWIRNTLGRKEMEPVGPTMFRYGFVFSIGLTLFPVAIISLAKMAQIVSRLF